MTLPSAGTRFRSAMKQKNDNNQPLQIAGAINAYTAMMATQVGHQALYLSGAGVANASFGLPDQAQGRLITYWALRIPLGRVQGFSTAILGSLSN